MTKPNIFKSLFRTIFFRISGQGDKNKTKCRRFSATLFAATACAVMLLAAPGFAQYTPYSPTNPNVTGSSLADRIARGELIFMPYHGKLTWNNDQIFTSYSQVKIPSAEYNFVVAKNQSLTQLTNITDKDFMVFGTYYNPVELNSDYSFSFDGDPTNPADSVRFHTMALFRDYDGIPTGRFPIRCTVTDMGVLPPLGSGSVTDTIGTDTYGAVLDYNLYIAELEEQTRTIKTAEEVPVPISLKCIPAVLPEPYALRISVSWDSASSNLYTDAVCSQASLITEDVTGGKEKQWVYSLQGRPEVIYYSRPLNDTSTETVTVKLIAIDDIYTADILSVQLTMMPSGSFLVRTVRGGRYSGSELKGFWDRTSVDPADKESTFYPSTEWKNNVAPFDSVAMDAPNMYHVNDTPRENNRPFVYNKNRNFKIWGGTIRHTDNTVYTNDDYKVTATSTNGKMTDAEAAISSDTNGVISFGAVTGSVLDKICAENVVIHWKLVNRNTSEEIDLGDTQHLVYVTGGSTSSGENAPYHTEVDIGTKGASGKTGDQRIANGVFHEFGSKQLKRIDGAGPLKYWGPATQASESSHDTADELLQTKDGDCIAWAAFTVATLDIQGISSSARSIKLKRDQNNGYLTYSGNYIIGFLQKEENVQGINGLDLYDNGNGIWFGMHEIVEYYDSDNNAYCYYDPGIAKGPYSTIAEYVRNEIKFIIAVKNLDDSYTATGTVDASVVPNPENYYYVEQ